MNDNALKSNYYKEITFPVCLLKDFYEYQEETANKILTYCFNAVKKKHGEKTAVQKIGHVKKFIPGFIETLSPPTHCSRNLINSIAHGETILDKRECITFLFVLAIRSIVSQKQYILTNWLFVASRMSGLRTPDKEKINQISKTITTRNHNLTMFLQEEIQKFGLKYYSCSGMHGFYIYRCTEKEFFEKISPIIKKEKSENDKKNIEKQRQKINIDTLRKFLLNGQLEEMLKPYLQKLNIDYKKIDIEKFINTGCTFATPGKTLECISKSVKK